MFGSLIEGPGKRTADPVPEEITRYPAFLTGEEFAVIIVICGKLTYDSTKCPSIDRFCIDVRHVRPAQVEGSLPDYLRKLYKKAVAACIQFERGCLVAGQWEFESFVIVEQWVGLFRSPSIDQMPVKCCIKAVG
jgi:hypothetical protein